MHDHPMPACGELAGPASYRLRRHARRHVAVCDCGWESDALASAGLVGALWYEHAVREHGVPDLR
jgi:hypothetical protein